MAGIGALLHGGRVMCEARVGGPFTRRLAWCAMLSSPLAFGGTWAARLGPRLPEGVALGTIAGFVLVQALSTASVTDALRGKIYNWTTYPAFLWALTLNGAAMLAPSQSAALGAVGPVRSLAGALACLAVMLLLHRMRGGGGGDVKLAVAMGALLGPGPGLVALGLAYVTAGLGALARTAWALGPRALATYLAILACPAWPGGPPPSPFRLPGGSIRLGPYYALGGLAVASDVFHLS